MVTKPLSSLVEHDLQKAQARDVIEKACPLLSEVFNYGTNVYGRCTASVSDKNLRPPNDSTPVRDEHIAIGGLFLNVLEHLDGLEPLVRECATFPAQAVLRGQFEATLQLEWMLKEDTLRRAHAYLAAGALKRLRSYRAFDPTTDEGKKLRDEMRTDRMGSKMELPMTADLPERIARYDRLLSKPYFKEAAEELHKVSHWYSCFGGPRTFRALAKDLHRSYEYDFLYRRWSGVVHGEEQGQRFSQRPGEKVKVSALRDPRDLNLIAGFGLAFGVDAIGEMLRFYRFDEMPVFESWYKRDIQPGYRWLATLRVQVT